MTTQAKKPQRGRTTSRAERTLVYRGIKIAPLAGKRSATAKALREALQTKTEQGLGEARG